MSQTSAVVQQKRLEGTHAQFKKFKTRHMVYSTYKCTPKHKFMHAHLHSPQSTAPNGCIQTADIFLPVEAYVAFQKTKLTSTMTWKNLILLK